MSDQPTIFEFLTQPEWKTCFAVAFMADTAEYGGEVDLRRFHVEGHEDTWESAIIAAVRYLALEHGMDFEGVMVREEDQEILAYQTTPVCPQNRKYLHLLGIGKLPDIPLALRTAARVLREKAPSFPNEAVREAAEEIEAQRDAVLASDEFDPEELKRTETFLDSALSTVGVERIKMTN